MATYTQQTDYLVALQQQQAEQEALRLELLDRACVSVDRLAVAIELLAKAIASALVEN